RAWEPDQLLDVVRDERRRAYGDVDRDAVRAEQLLAAHELARVDSRDPSRRAEQRERDLARDHVDRVAVRERDDDVGVAAARALDHVGVRRVADDGAHVEPVLELAQHVGILVDDRDLVGFFARKAERGGAADLPGAEDEYLHATTASRSLRRGAPPRWLASCQRLGSATEHPSRDTPRRHPWGS